MQKVLSLGIFELNPLHDTENKTARLAATSAFHFLQHAIKKKKMKNILAIDQGTTGTKAL